MRVASRLKKLEGIANQHCDVPRFTYEERHVAWFEFTGTMVHTNRLPDQQDWMSPRLDRFMADIQSQAVSQEADQFRRHIDGWVLKMWKVRGLPLPFVPPVLGSEYDDWDIPNLAARRLSVRYRPSVVALLGELDLRLYPGLQPAEPFDCLEVLRAECRAAEQHPRPHWFR